MYLGDFNMGAIVPFDVNTSDGDGASADFSAALEAADIKIFKNNSTTPRSSAAGVSISGAGGFASLAGITKGQIDLGDNTDADFFAPGNEYTIVLDPSDELLAEQVVRGRIGWFSINRRSALMPWVGKLTAVASGAIVTLPAECPAADDVLIGALVVPLSGTGKDQAGRSINAYTSGRVATLSPGFTVALDTTTYVGIVKAARASTIEQDGLVDAIGEEVRSGPTLAAISQANLFAQAMMAGNKLVIDTDTNEVVLYDTDGTTELGRVPYTRLPTAANPLKTVGG